MFTPITLTGRVTADLEIQTSSNGTAYIQFNVAVNKGFGEQEHANFYQCILFGKAAERLSKAGVKKGSLLFITGDLDLVKKRRKLIEAELPRFAVSIQQGLATDRDVLKLLTSYRRIAGPHLGQELDTTVADMRTGNYENALLHFQNRVGSTMLSDIVRGLIGTLRGDDQQMYFKMLVFDMRQIEQNNLKKEAGKRPKQMQKYSMMMLFCILLIYVVVLSVEVVGSLGAFF